jgi:allophanate hydrolase subunit 1
MKEKLENLRKKEEELFEIEQQLKKEREEIEISATLIKQLNNDLEKQKISQQKEQQRLKSLEKEIKQKENEEKSQLFQLEVDKSFKNSSQGSFHKILVSDMSPFDDKELFPL